MSDSPALLSPPVLDHFLNPRNVGDVPAADGVGEVGLAAFGDVVRLSFKLQDGRIGEARFRAYGCGTVIACASMTTELVRGRTLEEAAKFTGHEVSEALGGLPPVKAHCSALAEEAVKAAVNDCLRRQPR